MRSWLWIILSIGLLAACSSKAEKDFVTDDSIKKSIEEFRNRKIYTSLDPSVLASIPDDEVEMAIIDYVDAKLDGHYENESAIVSKLPAGVRALYVTWGVEAEVNNGGFNQYYWNSSGQFANEAVSAFEFFSANKHAALMNEANQVRNEEKAEIERFKDKRTLEAFSQSYKVSKLGPLDERFYKLDENLSALRVAKIRAEPKLFSAE